MSNKINPKSATTRHATIVGIIVFVLIHINLRRSSLLSDFISEHTGLTGGPLGATIAAICMLVPVAVFYLYLLLFKKRPSKESEESEE